MSREPRPPSSIRNGPRTGRFGSPVGTILLLTAILGALAVFGCDDSSSPTEPTAKTAREIVEGVSPYPPPPGEYDISVGDPGDTTITSNEGVEICIVEDFEMGRNPHEVIAFSPNANALWPGCLVQGAHLRDGQLVPVSVARAPCLVGVPRMGSDEVDDPNAFNVTGCIDELVTNYLAGHPDLGTELAFTMTETFTFEQGMLGLGISAEWPGGDLRSQFNYNWESQRHTLLLKFTQKYFTATAEAPSAPDAYFADSVTGDDLANVTSDGNPLCYVSSVSYGRIGILSMTSEYAYDEMSAALDLAMNDISKSGEINSSAWYAQTISQSEMKLLIIGGNSTDVVLSLSNPVEDLVDWINQGRTLTDVTQAKPIAYTVAHLKDNSVAAFQYTTSFSRRTCDWADQPVHVSVYKMHCVSDEEGTNPALEGWWDVWLTSYLPDLPEPIVKHAGEYFDGLRTGESMDITTASWDNYMPLQYGAKFELRMKLVEDDSFLYGGNDNLGDKTWTWTYPGYDQVPGDCTSDPPWCHYTSRFEENGQIIDVSFKIRMTD